MTHPGGVDGAQVEQRGWRFSAANVCGLNKSEVWFT